MRGGALPPALLCAVIGLLLAYAPKRAIGPAIASLVVAAVIAAFVPVSPRFVEIVFFGCWASVVVAAASIHIPKGPKSWLAMALATNAGLWAGAVVSVAGAKLDLAIALPWVLLVMPALWVRKTPVALAVKIVASWLGAVAILAGAVPLTPTPGYQPDHRE